MQSPPSSEQSTRSHCFLHKHPAAAGALSGTGSATQTLHPPPWMLPEETLPPTERPPSSPRTNPGAGHPAGCVRREQPRPHQQQRLQESAPLPVPRSAQLLAPPEPGRARRGCSAAQPPRHARLVCRLASVLCLDSSFPPFSVYTKTGMCITGSHTAVQNI